MANIRKRPSGKWQAQVRRNGRSLTRTFLYRQDAQTWARQMEAEADRSDLPFNRKSLKSITVGDLLERYRDAVLPKKRATTQRSEGGLLACLLRQDFTSLSLADATPTTFSDYRDKRLGTVRPATVCRELGLIQHAYELACREWGIPLDSNPVARIAKPSVQNRKERRIKPDEMKGLFAACQQCRNPRIEPLLRLALETGMRRSELVGINRGHIDLEARTLHIPHTKNGHARTIPLSRHALYVLKSTKPAKDGRLFPLTVNAVRLAWEDLRRRAKLRHVRFHDLRHEAVSRLFEKGLSVPEVALISGHQDLRMLYRYTHLSPSSVLPKLE